jgi:acyl-CoA thioester hydrolase
MEDAGHNAPDTMLAGRFEGGAHILDLRVYYEDTDFSGIVYHANYLRYFERGRTDCLRLAGLDQSRLYREGEGFAFVVRRMEIDFHRPALMDDLVRVETRLTAVKGASLVMAQRLMRRRQGGQESDADAEFLVGASVQVAAMRAGRAARLPGDLRMTLAGLMSDNGHEGGPEQA